MQAHKKLTLIAMLFASTAAWAQTPAPQWQALGPASYVCGGVSDEGMAAITSQRGSANGELLFTSGTEGAYLAQVAVTINGSGLQQPMTFTSSGPLCLLNLPAGSYTVEAEYKGRTVRQHIKTDGMLKQTKFNWSAA